MKAILGGCIGLLIGTAAAHAAIVTNGGFETGDFSGWTVANLGGVTPGIGPTVITTGVPNGTPFGDNVPPYEGTKAAYFVDDLANQTISQIVSLAANTKYDLSFALFQTVSGAGNAGSFSITDTVGGLVQSFSAADVSVGSWTAESGLFTTAAGGNYTLSFSFLSGATPSKDLLLDAVSISAVPLPASAPLFGAALLALGAAGYGMKRKAKAAAAA